MSSMSSIGSLAMKSSSGSNSCSASRRRAGVDEEAERHLALAERRLAKQPVVDRVEIERDPFEVGAVRLAPGRGDVAARTLGQHQLVHLMRDHRHLGGVLRERGRASARAAEPASRPWPRRRREILLIASCFLPPLLRARIAAPAAGFPWSCGHGAGRAGAGYRPAPRGCGPGCRNRRSGTFPPSAATGRSTARPTGASTPPASRHRQREPLVLERQARDRSPPRSCRRKRGPAGTPAA